MDHTPGGIDQPLLGGEVEADESGQWRRWVAIAQGGPVGGSHARPGTPALCCPCCLGNLQEKAAFVHPRIEDLLHPATRGRQMQR